MSSLSSLYDDMMPLVWSGIISGCLYGLGAIGLVMVFKCCRVVNFAHGNAAGFAAFLVFGFTGGAFLTMSWGAAVVCAICASLVIAGLSYIIIAPVIARSELTSTIATLGTGLILQGAIQLLFGSDIVNLDLPIPRFGMSVLGLRVTGYEIAVLLTTAICIGGLFLVIERTRLGVAFRAVSTNPFAVEICGLDKRRIHLFAWGAAAFMGVVAALLIVPTTFLSSTTLPSFMLNAFAAAVVGGFTSLPGAAVGGIVVGVLANLFNFYVSQEFTNTFLVCIVLFTLNIFPNGVLQRRAGSRV